MISVSVVTDIQGDETDILTPIKHVPLVICIHNVEEYKRVVLPESGWTHETIKESVDKT